MGRGGGGAGRGGSSQRRAATARTGATATGSRRTKVGGASGIEKYGKDAVDEVLMLDAGDDDKDEAESSWDEEEEVFAPEDDDDDDGPTHISSRGQEEAAGDEEEEDEDDDGRAVTSGWQRGEFYGGDDVGDESEGGSDEELVLKETRRLEKRRAQRLKGGEEDALADLLAADSDEDQSRDASKVRSADLGANRGSGKEQTAGARFEALLTTEAETESMPRDLSKLSESKKRSLMKKEAPELMPLLADFKEKLAGLQELLPLLDPEAVASDRVPATGKAYLEAKAGLLLNTLANLSFYILTRAEGGAVRAHPVVSQLVWLRALHEQLVTLDKRLGPQVQKAVRAAKIAPSLAKDTQDQIRTAAEKAAHSAEAAASASLVKKQPMTLRERISRMREADAAEEAVKAAKSGPSGPKSSSKSSTADLMRLPSSRRKGRRTDGGAGDDDAMDATLGLMQKASLSEELSAVQQKLGDQNRAARSARGESDRNVDPRARKPKDRADRRGMMEDEDEHPQSKIDTGKGADIGANDDDDLIVKARAEAKGKKAARAAAKAAAGQARVAGQSKPERVDDGRRKTSKKILENRGLVRQRKKFAGNARVSNRKKYEKAVKRRKGAVQDMQVASGDGATYSGEATGVRTHLRKSQKLA